MISVAFVRGAYLNGYELQSYEAIDNHIAITAISSKQPIDQTTSLPVIKLGSLADGAKGMWHWPIKVIANRTLGDMHVLYGLESLKNRFTIFHTADPHYYYSYQLAKLRQKNAISHVVATSWETIPHNNESTTAKRNLKYFVYEQVDDILCYTQKAVECVKKEGVDPEKIHYIPLGINTKRFVMKKKYCAHPKLLFVGRLVPEKGVLDLLESYTALKREFPWLSLTIVGDGPLHDACTKAGLQVHRVSYSDMPQVYQEADILVVPSKRTSTWEEQLGMVVLEGMASGLTVVGYQTGAIPEIIGKAGYSITPETKQLYLQLKQLLSEPTQVGKVGTMGRERVERLFNVELCAARLGDFYDQCYHSHEKRRADY